MANATVETKNGKTYLVLNEYDAEGGDVAVTLSKGEAIPNTNPVVYQGLITYEGQSIDVIEAEFINDVSNNDNVVLVITLADAGNVFTGLATDQNGNDLEYIQQTLSSSGSAGNNVLTFRYQVPPDNTDLLKEIYFHTQIGTLDPDDEVIRIPPH